MFNYIGPTCICSDTFYVPLQPGEVWHKPATGSKLTIYNES